MAGTEQKIETASSDTAPDVNLKEINGGIMSWMEPTPNPIVWPSQSGNNELTASSLKKSSEVSTSKNEETQLAHNPVQSVTSVLKSLYSAFEKAFFK